LAIFVALSALAASAASASEPQWKEVANGSEATIEVDEANIRIRDSRLTAWVRSTSPREIEKDGVKFRSAISLHVFECDTERSGVHSATVFAGPRGDGKVVDTDEGLPVSLVHLSYERPGTTGYRILEFVCGMATRARDAHADSSMPQSAEPEQTMLAREKTASVHEGRSASQPAQITRPADPRAFYPAGSLRREEQGSPVVQACVGPRGRLLREPVIAETSGFPDLDAAALKVAKATRYAAGKQDDIVLPESCLKFKIDFHLTK
jgi:TonB family protein